MFYTKRRRAKKFRIRLLPNCDSVVLSGNSMEKLLQWVRFIKKQFTNDLGQPMWASHEKLVYDRQKKSRGKRKKRGDFYVELYSYDCSHMYRIYTQDVERLLRYKTLRLKPCRKASKDDYEPFEGGR